MRRQGLEGLHQVELPDLRHLSAEVQTQLERLIQEIMIFAYIGKISHTNYDFHKEKKTV